MLDYMKVRILIYLTTTAGVQTGCHSLTFEIRQFYSGLLAEGLIRRVDTWNWAVNFFSRESLTVTNLP